jgi:ATP-binding protein involved in chromosome partitioning
MANGNQIEHMVAVSSGKGGVGKSTVSANLAVAWAQQGYRVGLLDADITGPNLPIIMGLSGHPAAGGDRLLPFEAFGVKVMSMGFLVDPNQAVIWRGPMIHHAIRQLINDVAWGELDYMVIDLPPGTGDAQLTLAQSVPLTGAIIVTQPQEMALGDARRGMSMFAQVDVPVLGVIENMSGDFFGEGGGKQLAEERGVPFLGSVPLDAQVRIGGDTGRPIIVDKPESAAAIALKAIADEVISLIDAIADDDEDIIPLQTIG